MTQESKQLKDKVTMDVHPFSLMYPDTDLKLLLELLFLHFYIFIPCFRGNRKQGVVDPKSKLEALIMKNLRLGKVMTPAWLLQKMPSPTLYILISGTIQTNS